MKKFIFLSIYALCQSILFGQEPFDSTLPWRKNNININIIGEGSLLSLNYERFFIPSPKFMLTSKIGLGYNEEFQLCFSGGCSDPAKSFLTLPHSFTGNIGKGRHFFEFGFGGTIIVGNTDEHYFFYPILGYRIQHIKSKKYNLRIYCSIPSTLFMGKESGEVIFYLFPLV